MEGQSSKRGKKQKANNQAEQSLVSQTTGAQKKKKQKQTSLKNVYQIHDFGDEQNEDEQNEDESNVDFELPFEHNFNKYIQLRLAKIIPPKDGVMIKPQKKVVHGQEQKVRQFIKKVNQELEMKVMKKVNFKNKTSVDEIDDEMDKKFEAQVIRPKRILIVIDHVRKEYGFQQEAQELKEKINIPKAVMILIRLKKEYKKECEQKLNQILTRQDELQKKSKDIEEKNKKINRNCDQYQQKTEDFKPNSVFISKIPSREQQIPQKRKFIQKRYQKKEEEPQIRQEQKGRDGRRILRETFIQKQYNSTDFDPIDCKNWIKKNKIIEINDVEITPIMDQKKPVICAYKVVLSSLRGVKRQQKIKNFQIYTKFQNTINLNIKTQNRERKEEVIKRFQRDTEQIMIKVVKGYQSQNQKSKHLWSLIENHKIQQRKSNYCSIYVEVFHLKGLRNAVDKAYEEIKKALDEIPLQDIEVYINFDLNEIAKEIRKHNKKLKELIQDEIRYQFGKIKQSKQICQIKKVEFPLLEKVRAYFSVKFDKEDQFKSLQSTLKIIVQNSIKIEKYQAKFQKISIQNLKRHLLVIYYDDKEIHYIQANRNATKNNRIINEELNEGMKSVQKMIHVTDKFMLNKLKKYFQTKKQKAQYCPNVKYFQKKAQYCPNVKYFQKIAKSQNYQFQICIIGPFSEVNCFFDDTNAFLQNAKSNISAYRQIRKAEQIKIIGEDVEIQDLLDKNYQVSMSFEMNSIINAKIIIQSHQKKIEKKVIIIRQSKTLDCAPFGSTIIFNNKKDIEKFDESFLKNFQEKIHKNQSPDQILKQQNRDYILLLLTSQKMKCLDFLILSGIKNSSPPYKFVLIMPENNKADFLRELIEAFFKTKELCCEVIDILIIEHKAFEEDIQKIVGLQQFKCEIQTQVKDQQVVKWYVMDSHTKFYYSQKGNNKINEHINKSNEKILYLVNEDVNICHFSHKYNLQTNVMTHIISGSQVVANKFQDRIQFKLKDLTCTMPSAIFRFIRNQSKKIRINQEIDISLGVYEINLQKMTQTNMFSTFPRRLYQEKEKPSIKPYDFAKGMIRVQYNLNINQIIYSFSQDSIKNLKKSTHQIQQYLKKKISQEVYNVEGITITSEFKKNVLEKTQDFNVEIQFDEKTKKVLIRSYDPKNIKMIKVILDFQKQLIIKSKENAIQYPKQWSKQTLDIDIFTVPSTSQEFLDVQKIFTCSKIKELVRLQNTIIYKKYYDERLFLKNLNKGIMQKQMLLFHGTRTTNPELIYKDKQECFNINYSSEKNYLGRGIYFAEKSEYSTYYKYTEETIQGSINSMFLCTVIVGDSEKCPALHVDYKDTSIKDSANNLKYESMTEFLEISNVFVVYKNRRAYPLYLIKY